MTVWIWTAFIIFVLAMLVIDLGVFHRKPHAIKAKEALIWTGIWVALALVFNVLVYFMYEHQWLGIGAGEPYTSGGKNAAIDYLQGYLIEKSLSLDNIFIIALIFTHFRVPDRYQHRVLFWGILGAIVLRGVMIALGVVLIRKFDWITYVFGAILLVSAIRMLFSRKDGVDPERSRLVRYTRKLFPVTDDFEGQKFFVKQNGATAVTPLFLVLMVIEGTDVMFAVDSIPAIFAVTQDPFIVFTSNIFAILGLRALYFALASVIDRFRYIKPSLVILLAFVGVKLILSHHVEIPPLISLGIIIGILATGVTASVVADRRSGKKKPEERRETETSRTSAGRDRGR